MRYLFLIFASLILVHANAQNEAVVSGRIMDRSTGKGLQFASVSIVLAEGEDIIAGAISGEGGIFMISGLPEGDYLAKVSFIGYIKTDVPFLVGELSSYYDLGRIELEPSTEEIDEVTISARREIVSSDLAVKSYSMEDNVAQSGGSVLDAMKTLPGVIVDQEGKVILRGSDKVAVLIDGKQSSLTGFGNQKSLDNIPAANIEKIEIINNPSAKYDASGMAGIINIVYRKENENGFNGDVGIAMGLGQLNKTKPDLPTSLGSYSMNKKLIPSLNLNYRTRKLNFFLQSELLSQNGLPNNEFTTRAYNDGRTIVSQVPENRTQNHVILKGGMDWDINDNNSLTFSGIYDYEKHVDTAQVPFIDLSNNERYRYWAWREIEITGYMNYAADYTHKFVAPGHELSASAQFTKGWEDESYNLNDSSAIRKSGDATHILATEYTTFIKTDYLRPMASGRLETGLKLQWRRIPVEYTVEPGENSIIYPGLGDWSGWSENIYSGYVNYILERKHYEIEAGLRLEQTDVAYEIAPENIYYQKKNDSYDYLELFPNIRLSLNINDFNRISAFYNRRIDRPGEPELRIFPKYDDPELLKVGNPYLRPQFTRSFEIAYRNRKEKGIVYLSVFHRLIDDAYMRIYSQDTTNINYDIINKIYQNTGSATNTGTEFLLTREFTDWLKVSESINLYRNEIHAYEGTLLFPYQRPFRIENTVDFTWDAKFNAEFELKRDVNIQFTWIYYAPKNIPQGRQFSRSSADIGVKKKLLNSKGELSLSFTDMLNNFGIRQELVSDGFTVLYENLYETQVLRLGFKYKF